MIADAIDTVITLGWVLLAWIAILSAVGTITVLAVAAGGAWAIRTLRRRHTRPSWARSPLRARFLARHRARPPHARTDDPTYEEAA